MHFSGSIYVYYWNNPLRFVFSICLIEYLLNININIIKIKEEGAFHWWSSNPLARRFLSVTKEISMPGPAEVASDEFANTAWPFADWRDFLIFRVSNLRRHSDFIILSNTLTIGEVNDFCNKFVSLYQKD